MEWIVGSGVLGALIAAAVTVWRVRYQHRTAASAKDLNVVTEAKQQIVIYNTITVGDASVVSRVARSEKPATATKSTPPRRDEGGTARRPTAEEEAQLRADAQRVRELTAQAMEIPSLEEREEFFAKHAPFVDSVRARIARFK